MRTQCIDPQVSQLRDISRQFSRVIGFMKQEIGPTGITHPQFHTMQTLHQHGAMSIKDISEKLHLDGSSMSRTIDRLIDRGWVKATASKDDQRKKIIQVTKAGLAQMHKVDEFANSQVSLALSTLSNIDRQRVIDGFQLYTEALQKTAKRVGFSICPLERKYEKAVGEIILSVLEEFKLTQPGFASEDSDLFSLYERYEQPHSKFWVVLNPDKQVVGCGGFAPLEGGSGDICEIQKFYFLPEYRGRGLARVILEAALTEARDEGFKVAYLETHSSMREAQGLYLKFGFEHIKGPWGDTGHYGCDVWMAKRLDVSSPLP